MELILGVAGQLQLAHFFEELKPVSRIVEGGDIPDAGEYPLGLDYSGNPEQIAVSDESAVAPRHPALQRSRSLMQRNDALAFLRVEPTCTRLAIVKSFPHVPHPLFAAAAPPADHPKADLAVNSMAGNLTLPYHYVNY